MGWTIALLLVCACGFAAAVCREINKDKTAETEFKKLVSGLSDDSDDPAVRQALLYAIRQPHFARVSKRLSGEAYEVALANLSAHSSQISARSFAIELGRWHFGRSRPKHITTMADEQTIENDILRRCHMLVPSCTERRDCTE